MAASGNKRIKRYVTLELPPAGAHFSALVDALLEKGVVPPLSALVPKQWTYKEFDSALGHKNFEGKQVREWRRNKRLPADTHKIEMVLFGPDEADYHDWRLALRKALADANRSANRRNDIRSAAAVIKHARRHPTDGLDESVGRLSSPPPPVQFPDGGPTPKSLRDALRTSIGRVVLCGPPGVGKTTLADAYATTYRSSYQRVARIDAFSRDRCASDLVAFGRHLGCSDSHSSADDVLKTTLAHLSASSNDILLIFDGAGNLATLLPFLPSPYTVHVIITSRSPHWETHAKVLPIKPWSIEQGAVYLKRRDQLGSSDQSTIALLADLGGLPAALEMAAVCCERRKMSHDQFHTDYVAGSFQVLELDDLPVTYPHNLLEVYSSLIATAEATAAGASFLLAVLNELSHHPVPVALLESACSDTKYDFGSALSALASLSLITIEAKGGNGASCRVVRADRLARRVAAKIGPPSKSLWKVAWDALTHNLPSGPLKDGIQILHARLLAPHTTYLLEKVPPLNARPYNVRPFELGMLALDLGRLLVAVGKPLEAMTAFGTSYDWLRQSDERTLVAFPLWHLSDALIAHGQHARAERPLRLALQLFQSQPDNFDAGQVAIKLSLIKIAQAMSRPSEAHAIMREVNEMMAGYTDPDHPLVLEVREVRALVDLTEGKIDAACVELADVLAARKRDPETEPFRLAASMWSLARACAAAKLSDEAIDYMARAHDLVLLANDPESEAIGASWLDVAFLKLNTSTSKDVSSDVVLALKTLRRPSLTRLAALELGARMGLDFQRNPDIALAYAMDAVATANRLRLWVAEKAMAELACHALRRVGRDHDATVLKKRYAN